MQTIKRTSFTFSRVEKSFLTYRPPPINPVIGVDNTDSICSPVYLLLAGRKCAYGFPLPSLYAFTRSETNWAESARLVGYNPTSSEHPDGWVGLTNDNSYAAALNSDRIVAYSRGGPRDVYVFDHSGQSWNQRTSLKERFPDISFFKRVAMSDDYVITSAFNIFDNTEDTLIFKGKGTTSIDGRSGDLPLATSGDFYITVVRDIDDGGGAAYIYKLGPAISTSSFLTDAVYGFEDRQ